MGFCCDLIAISCPIIASLLKMLRLCDFSLVLAKFGKVSVGKEYMESCLEFGMLESTNKDRNDSITILSLQSLHFGTSCLIYTCMVGV